MLASNAVPVSAVMVCASMSSLVTVISAPAETFRWLGLRWRAAAGQGCSIQQARMVVESW
jgi:hypothetical protein